MRFLSLVAIFHVICNNDDRRQRRIEGEVVGAAASRTRVHLHEANAGSRNPALASVSETERFNST